MKKTTIPEEENKVTVLGQQQDKLLVLTRGSKQNYVFLYLQLYSHLQKTKTSFILMIMLRVGLHLSLILLKLTQV